MKTSPRPIAKPSRRPADRVSNRGSVLMVALIIAGVIAISLTSFMQLASNAAKLSNRSFYMDGAQNLADLGLEHSLWSMNNGVWTTGNTYQVTLPSTSESTTISSGGNFVFSGNVKGQVKIYADLTDASKPHVVVKASVTLNDGSVIEKLAEAYIKSASWADDGVVAPHVDVSNNVTMNSWNSDPDGNASTPAIPYSSAVAGANITVAATDVTAGALDNGGKIYGNVAAGSSASGGGIVIGIKGIVGNATYLADYTHNKGTIQDGHSTYDFTASFPDVSAPAAPGGSEYTIATGNITLPRTSPLDTPASDGNYYYYVSSISLAGSDQLHIAGGNVVLRIGNSTMSGSALSLTGTASIAIDTGATLKVYTSGDVKIAGNGITSGGNTTTTANQPINFQLYGTRSGSDVSTLGYQSLDVHGNGVLSGVVYAPNANVSAIGSGSGGDIMGAIIGNSVTIGGNSQFHYDESLASTLSSGIWKLRKWRDLTNATNRTSYETLVNF